MDKMVEDEMKYCESCQAAVYKNDTEPLRMSELPNGPWESIKVDFYGPLPSGLYLLTVVDEYSRWAEVEPVSSTSAAIVVPVLNKVFATYGIPYKITSDNGPPFKGAAMKSFCEFLAIDHRRITPYWPKANSSAENFNRCLRKVMQTANLENIDWKEVLCNFLRNYRSTPHISTGRSPADLMFNGRAYRTKLPARQHEYDDAEVRKTDALAKERMEAKADRKCTVKECDISVGNYVLVKQQHKNKLSTPFSPTRYKVIKRNGSMITATSLSTGKQVTRNSSFFKKVPVSSRDKMITDELLDARIVTPEDVTAHETDDENLERDFDNSENVTGQQVPRRNPGNEEDHRTSEMILIL